MGRHMIIVSQLVPLFPLDLNSATRGAILCINPLRYLASGAALSANNLLGLCYCSDLYSRDSTSDGVIWPRGVSSP